MKKWNTLKLIILIQCMVVYTVAAQITRHQKKHTNTSNDIYYLEYLPPNYNSNTEYPLMVFLHGCGETAFRSGAGDCPKPLNSNTDPYAELNKVDANGPPREIEDGETMCFMVGNEQNCFIVLSPQLNGRKFTSWNTGLVDEFLQYALRTYPVDRSRIYLTGLSLGCIGTYNFAKSGRALTDSLAAIVGVCGNSSTTNACNIADRNIPVWGFHGTNDNVVSYSSHLNFIEAIGDCNPDPQPAFTTFEGAGHSIWGRVYNPDNTYPEGGNKNVYQWMLSHTKTYGNPPDVNAGLDRTITLPTNSVTLNGSATDDGTVVSYFWTKEKGPSATLSGTNQSTLTVTDMVVGEYVFRLRATDNDGLQAYDEVTVTVRPEDNQSIDSWLELTSDGVSGKRIEFYYDGARQNSHQQLVRASGNDFLELYIKTISGEPNWASLQVGMTVKYQNKYVNVGQYISNISNEWTKVTIPLAAFDHSPDRWETGGVSNIGLKIISNFSTDEVVFGIDEIRFTGGTIPFVWYGDDYETSGSSDATFTLDPFSFYVSNRYVTGGVGGAEPEEGSWLHFFSNSSSGKRVELYYDETKSNAVQQSVRAGGNDFLQFYIKTLSGNPNWNSLQVGLTVSYENKYVNVGGYLKETSHGWTRVEVPLADFLHTPSRWTSGGVSNVGFKVISNFGTGNIEFGIDEIHFTGGATPFVWYGDAHELPGSASATYTLDNTAFYISDRPQTGGVMASGSQSAASMSAASRQSTAEVYTVQVYDMLGYRAANSGFRVEAVSVDAIDFRQLVPGRGHYIFRIASPSEGVVTKQIIFAE